MNLNFRRLHLASLEWRVARSSMSHNAHGAILNGSLADSIHRFSARYSRTRGSEWTNPHVVELSNDLATYSAELKTNPKVQLVSNRTDKQDVARVESTLTSSQVTVLPGGGHLGNLDQPTVQGAILRAIHGPGPQTSPPLNTK